MSYFSKFINLNQCTTARLQLLKGNIVYAMIELEIYYANIKIKDAIEDR